MTQFNLTAFADKVDSLLATQNSLLIILNTPAHNPTGYALTSDEWDGVLDVIKNHAAKGKKISLLADVAYIDFSADKKIAWSFAKKFANMPSNVLIMLAFSMSKSYTFYGQRTGALAAFSTDADVIKEFDDTNKFSCRATWSNVNNGAQVICSKIYRDEKLRADLEKDQADLRNLVNSRAKIFVDEAVACGLKIVPYKGGFFIAVPAENPAAICEKLHEDLIFAVPLKLGIRVAVCSMPLVKIPGVAEKLHAAMKIS